MLSLYADDLVIYIYKPAISIPKGLDIITRKKYQATKLTYIRILFPVNVQ